MKGPRPMLPRHWFKHETEKCDNIKVGAIFRHKLPGDIIETAKVLEIGPDPLGIPHVTYELQVEKSQFAKYQARRTLGLQSFSERFEETVTA